MPFGEAYLWCPLIRIQMIPSGTLGLGIDIYRNSPLFLVIQRWTRLRTAFAKRNGLTSAGQKLHRQRQTTARRRLHRFEQISRGSPDGSVESETYTICSRVKQAYTYVPHKTKSLLGNIAPWTCPEIPLRNQRSISWPTKSNKSGASNQSTGSIDLPIYHHLSSFTCCT